jgi:hypothetical protein
MIEMMKKKYSTPKLTVVNFLVEDGFDSFQSAPFILSDANASNEQPMEQRSLSSNGWADNE